MDLTGQKLLKSRELSINIINNSWRHGMSSSADKIDVPHAENVTITEDTLSVDLSDGRTIPVPLAWFPRLRQSTPDEEITGD